MLMTTTKLRIRLYGDPCLRKKSLPVKQLGPNEQALIQAMMAAMYEHKGVGLAAVQVGVHQRIFVADIGEGPVVFVNPQIVTKSGSAVCEEGCLSIPEVTVSIERPQKVLVRYMNENNQPVERPYEDLMARVILHETDHLNGRLIIDYASWKAKLKLRGQLKKIKQTAQQAID